MPRPVASTSFAHLRPNSRPRPAVRAYATPPNPHLAAPTDSRVEVIRQTLYPPDAPAHASPTGVHRPDVVARLQHAIPSAEVHETIERAWQLRQRQVRAAREAALRAKHAAMVAACDELDRLTRTPGSGLGREVYDRAMVRMNHAAGPSKVKKTPEDRFEEARIEGLVPREAWVPTETRGKGWNYAWRRPGKE